MQPTSLGYRTDLIFHRFEGEVTDRGHYLVIHTPSNPSYRWGNLLIFDAPPEAGILGSGTGFLSERSERHPASRISFLPGTRLTGGTAT